LKFPFLSFKGDNCTLGSFWGLFSKLGIWGLGFLTHALREKVYPREVQKFNCLNLKLETLVLDLSGSLSK